MSMNADLINTMKQAKDKYNLEDFQVIELYVNIVTDVGWEFDDVDYDSDKWAEQEVLAAKKALEL
jgi:hypothetical protein